MTFIRLRIIRPIRFFFQRLFRGFDDSETWSLDITISKFVLPRLKRFRNKTIGFPGGLDSITQWYKILDDMIYAFEYDINQFEIEDETKVDYKRVNRGFKYFARYYSFLWW